MANGEGTCVSLFVQGCPHRCKGCHNPESWEYNGGKEFTREQYLEIFQAITANGILRNFSLLGGEPLCPDNFEECAKLIHIIRINFPSIKIFVWTGYLFETLASMYGNKWKEFLTDIDVLIDGQYDESKRDITLPLRGSSNQRILKKGESF